LKFDQNIKAEVVYKRFLNIGQIVGWYPVYLSNIVSLIVCISRV